MFYQNLPRFLALFDLFIKNLYIKQSVNLDKKNPFEKLIPKILILFF